MILGAMWWNVVNYQLTECLRLKVNLNKCHELGPFCYVMLGCHSVISCSCCWLFCHGELVLLHWFSVRCCTIVIRYFIFWVHLKHRCSNERWTDLFIESMTVITCNFCESFEEIYLGVLFSRFWLLVCDMSSSC